MCDPSTLKKVARRETRLTAKSRARFRMPSTSLSDAPDQERSGHGATSAGSTYRNQYEWYTSRRRLTDSIQQRLEGVGSSILRRGEASVNPLTTENIFAQSGVNPPNRFTPPTIRRQGAAFFCPGNPVTQRDSDGTSKAIRFTT